MYLSQLGVVANEYWKEIPKHFPFVELGEYVVMPNHVHGIVTINKSVHLPDTQNTQIDNLPTQETGPSQTQNTQNVETQNFASLRARVNLQTQGTGGSQTQNTQNVETQNPASLQAQDNLQTQSTGGSQTQNTQNAETQNFASIRARDNLQLPFPPNNKFGPQSKNLGSIIRGYKAGVAKYATLNRLDFKWQARFHDHIIRNEDEFRRIQHYIVTNPQRWKEDKFYTES